MQALRDLHLAVKKLRHIMAFHIYVRLLNMERYFKKVESLTAMCVAEPEKAKKAKTLRVSGFLLTLWPPVFILRDFEMQHKSPHAKTASQKLTFVVISDAGRPSRTFMASKFQLGFVVLFGFVVIGALSVVALIYTPIGRLALPGYFSTQQEQLEKIQRLESKVGEVEQQMTYLSSYNERLRKILGGGSSTDTTGGESSSQAADNEPVEVPQQQAGKGIPVEKSSLYTSVPSETEASTQSRTDVASIFPLMMPANGYITRGVNYQIQHYGVDISAPIGSPVVAPAPGVVIFVDWTLTGGNTLMIAHAGNFMTVYKHCERILVSVGTKVSRGEVVALVGSTGVTSTGPHLHFELWQDGRNLNPENYLLTKN